MLAINLRTVKVYSPDSSKLKNKVFDCLITDSLPLGDLSVVDKIEELKRLSRLNKVLYGVSKSVKFSYLRVKQGLTYIGFIDKI